MSSPRSDRWPEVGSGRIMTVVALIAAAMVAVTACGPDTARTGGSGGPIQGAWVLSEYSSGGVLQKLPGGLTTTITFAGQGVDGRAAVNSYRGPFTADGAEGSLSIGPLATTQIGGDAAAMAAESDYLRAVQAAASYTAGQGRLTVFGAKGETLLVYAEDSRTVVGSWQVTGFNNGREAVVSPAGDSEITATFGDDLTLTGDSGVNRYRTTYEISSNGGGITIAPPAGTRKAGEPALMEQEGLYLAALESAATFTLQGDVLTLRDASDAIAVTLTRS